MCGGLWRAYSTSCVSNIHIGRAQYICLDTPVLIRTPCAREDIDGEARVCVAGCGERVGNVLYPYMTCPVHVFGHAGTNLGRAGGRDLLACLSAQTLMLLQCVKSLRLCLNGTYFQSWVEQRMMRRFFRNYNLPEVLQTSKLTDRPEFDEFKAEKLPQS